MRIRVVGNAAKVSEAGDAPCLKMRQKLEA
jgi:hypothetical protein